MFAIHVSGPLGASMIMTSLISIHEYLEALKNSIGKESHPFQPKLLGEANLRYEGCRDHSHLLQHLRAKLLSWKANNDSQAILDRNLLKLLGYLKILSTSANQATETTREKYNTDTETTYSFKHLINIYKDN